MLNLLVKKECAAARALGEGNKPGAVYEPPSKPVQQRTFFMRRSIKVPSWNLYSTGAGKAILMAVRTELECSLHRLANHVECKLSDILHELLSESRTEAVHDIAWAGCRFVESCRNVRDGKEGGDE